MKKLVLALCFLLCSAYFAHADEPRIATTEPMIGSYSTTYQGRTRVIISIAFMEDKDPTRSILLSDLLNVSMKATIAATPPDKTVQLETKTDDKSTQFRFLIDVGQVGGTFSLPANWSEFKYQVSYRYRKEGNLIDGKSGIIQVDRKAEEITLTARWGLPIWFNEPSKDKVIRIPLTVGPPIGVKVSLFRKGENNPVATKEDVTGKNDLKEIALETEGIIIRQGDEFRATVEPIGLPVTLSNAEQQFTIQSRTSYDISKTSLDFLKKKLLVTSVVKPFSFDVITTSPGSLQMSLSDGPFRSPKVSGENTSTFELSPEELKKMDDGTYSVAFAGKQGASDAPLGGLKTFVLVVAAAPELVGMSTFKVDQDNLIVTFNLTREVPNQWFLSDLEDKGTVRLNGDSKCSVKNEKVECVATIKLSDSAIVKAVDKRKDSSLPVKLRIVSNGPGSQGDEITSFGFDFVNVGLVKQKLEEVKAGLEKKTMNDDQAKQTIASALGIKSPPDVTTDDGKKQQDAIDYVMSLLKGKDSKPKDKFLSILKFVGNVAATFFGVPIKIP